MKQMARTGALTALMLMATAAPTVTFPAGAFFEHVFECRAQFLFNIFASIQKRQMFAHFSDITVDEFHFLLSLRQHFAHDRDNAEPFFFQLGKEFFSFRTDDVIATRAGLFPETAFDTVWAFEFPDAATLVYLGPPDAGTSTISATPRRIAADGVETTTLRYLPRDAANEALGAGRTVGFSQQPDLGLVVGQVRDLGDGAYEATVTAGAVEGATDVAAFLAGGATGSAARVSLAWGDKKELGVQFVEQVRK